MYATFAAAADTPRSSSSARTSNLTQVYHAITQHPDFVTGEERFCTELMEVYEGQLVGKLGADGCYALGIRACADTKRLDVYGAMGIAVKVDDGNYDILYAVVMEVLQQLEIGILEVRDSLQQWRYFKRRNTMDFIVRSINLGEVKLHDGRHMNSHIDTLP
jgi:L-asparaginase II